MPLSRARDYLSIGELLEAVKPEFPDVTISKIRFLESEGLIEPERTESGYRKFYERDVERLRSILTLQRDHFMPLKVIKERMAGGAPPPVPNGTGPVPISQPQVETSSLESGGVQMDRPEFLRATGLSEHDVSGLEEFGILNDRGSGVYDEADLLIGKAAKGFLELGVEPRHLRMYRQFADRESSLFEQLLGTRKNAAAPKGAAEKLTKLVALSRTMREGILRDAVRSS